MLIFLCHNTYFHFLAFVLEVGHDLTVNISLQRPPYEGGIEPGPRYRLFIQAQHQFRVAGTIIHGDVAVYLLLFQVVTQVIGCLQHGGIVAAKHLGADGLARRRPALYFQE